MEPEIIYGKQLIPDALPAHSDGLAYSVLNLCPLNKEQALEMYRVVTTLGEGGSI
jgi:hypothetical protein